MGMFKPDFFRSLAIGFALGAVAVFATFGFNMSQTIANGVAPVAEAAPAR